MVLEATKSLWLGQSHLLSVLIQVGANNNNMSNLPLDGVNASKTSQDVFLESDQDGRVHLTQSNHAGSHFFKSMAELNRAKFVDETSGYRVALSIVHTIWNKGQGKIYMRDAETNGWNEITRIGPAQTLVFGALENLLGVETRQQEQVPGMIVAGRSEEQTGPNNEQDQQGGSTVRRHSATTLEAASSLLMVQATLGQLDDDSEEEEEKNQVAPPKVAEQQVPEQQHVAEPEEEKSALQVKFENTNIANITSFDSSSSSSAPSSPESDHGKEAAAASAPKPKNKPERRRRSACPSSDYVANQPGIEFAKVDSSDVLCGGSGEGVLAIRHEGNKRFLKAIEAELDEFESSDDKGKLRMAQQTVERTVPRGRFLAYNPETGLWHELKRDKAWFKSLRTFLKRQRPQDGGASESKPRSLPLPVRR